MSLLALAPARALAGPDAGAPRSDARADAGTGDAKARERALDLTDLGERAYREGRLAEAADLLRQAYDLYPSAVLLYNMARIEESAGNEARAADLYEEYLRAEPEAQYKATIEKRVATLRQRLRERADAQRERDVALSRAKRAEQAAQRQPSSPSSSAPPWITMGVGVAGVAAGIVFGVVASGQESAAEDEPTHAGALDHFSRAEDFATAANVALVAGGVVGAAGLVWLLVRSIGDGHPSPKTATLPTTTLGW